MVVDLVDDLGVLVDDAPVILRLTTTAQCR